MPQTKTYNPKAVQLSFLGNIASGYAEGTMITATRNEDDFTAQAGTTGEVTRVANCNRTGTVTIRLKAASQFNDVLSALRQQDLLFGNALGPLFIKELNGTTLVSAAEAWIKRQPDMERGKEESVVEWTLECADLDAFLGGLV